MTRTPERRSGGDRGVEMPTRGVPPAFWAPLRRDPLLMVADRLIAPGARVLAWLSPAAPEPPRATRARELVLVDREVVAADEDVVSLVFAHPRGAALRGWSPGAHVDLVLPSGRMRQYSLCGDPDDPFHYRIAVRRIPNGSACIEVHELRPGARVRMHGPRNAFPLALAGHGVPREPISADPSAPYAVARDGRASSGGGSIARATVGVPGEPSSDGGFADHVPRGLGSPGGGGSGALLGAARPRIRFVAGGIGITPILGMMRAADRAGADWSLLYTGRHRDALPFLDEIARYRGRVTVRTDDEAGLPTGAELVPRVEPGLAVYVCGPPALLAVVAARVARAPGVALHHERFAPPPIVDGQRFTVQWGRRGRVFDIPADRTVLSVLAEADPTVSYSCRQGFCTTCKVRVLSGAVDHRDTVLDAEQRARGDMLICVSRAPAGETLVLEANTGAAVPVSPPPERRYRVRLARAMPKRSRLGGVNRVP